MPPKPFLIKIKSMEAYYFLTFFVYLLFAVPFFCRLFEINRTECSDIWPKALGQHSIFQPDKWTMKQWMVSVNSFQKARFFHKLRPSLAFLSLSVSTSSSLPPSLSLSLFFAIDKNCFSLLLQKKKVSKLFGGESTVNYRLYRFFLFFLLFFLLLPRYGIGHSFFFLSATLSFKIQTMHAPFNLGFIQP